MRGINQVCRRWRRLAALPEHFKRVSGCFDSSAATLAMYEVAAEPARMLQIWGPNAEFIEDVFIEFAISPDPVSATVACDTAWADSAVLVRRMRSVAISSSIKHSRAAALQALQTLLQAESDAGVQSAFLSALIGMLAAADPMGCQHLVALGDHFSRACLDYVRLLPALRTLELQIETAYADSVAVGRCISSLTALTCLDLSWIKIVEPWAPTNVGGFPDGILACTALEVGHQHMISTGQQKQLLA